MKRKPTIEELQAILDDPRQKNIYINPDGSITTSKRRRGCKKWKRTQQATNSQRDEILPLLNEALGAVLVGHIETAARCIHDVMAKLTPV